MRIITLLARHGTAKYTNALPDLQSLFRSTLPHVHHELIIADNALPLGHVEMDAAGYRVIGASNEAWEFSAWDSAIEYLGRVLDDYDFVHLATSAFNQLYVRYLTCFSEGMLETVKGRGVAIGHVDYYGQAVNLLGVGCQSWLRSSYVFLPPSEVRLLGSLVSTWDERAFFGQGPAQPFLNDAPVSLEYRKNILGWLTGAGTEQGTEWHSRFELNEQTLPFFKSKTLAIFNEQMLSNRLRAQGCAVIDVTWLSAAVRKRSWRPGNSFPPWQVQVSRRDVDAAPMSLQVRE